LNDSPFPSPKGIKRKKSQIIPVLATSIVALDAAEAYLVTEQPNPLKRAIENIRDISKKIIA